MPSPITRKLFFQIPNEAEHRRRKYIQPEIDDKNLKAKFTILSHSWAHNDDGIMYQCPPPVLYSFEEYYAQIFALIHENNHQQLEEYLKSYFIYPDSAIDDELNVEYSREYTVEKYKIYKIRPFMERLILECPIVFESLLNETATKPDCRKALLNSLENLNLCGAVFNGLNLNHANFKNTNLKGAFFTNTDVTNANFSFSQLENTVGLTPEKLDSCATYEKAVLPTRVWPYWDKDIKDQIKAGLLKLKIYGTKLIVEKKSIGKGQKIKDHADAMLNQLNSVEDNNNVSHSFKQSFINKLNCNGEFNNPRDRGVKIILTNIALCIIGAGIGYLIAIGINKIVNNRFLFFSRTTSQQKIDKVSTHCISPTLKT